MTEAELTPLILDLLKQKAELDKELYVLECELAAIRCPYAADDVLINEKGVKAFFIKAIPAKVLPGYLCVVRKIKANGGEYSKLSEIWPYDGWRKMECL